MLPKIDLPSYDLKLPSNGKIIKVRPFVVKEEKLLLMAMESDEDDIDRVTLQVVNNCILDDTDVETLPFFDVDYIFIFLRAKSVGESIEVKFTCNHIPDETGERCGITFPARIDISKYEVSRKEGVSEKIRLSDNTMIIMKYPNYHSMRKIVDGTKSEIEEKIELIADCVDKIVMGEDVYARKDYTPEEIKDFLENLPQLHFRKLEEFVDNFPSFVVVAEKDCPKCGFHHKLEYTEYADFFE